MKYEQKASSLYIPDYRACENLNKKWLKDTKRSVRFETESEALKQQQEEEVLVNAERVKLWEQKQTEPNIINVNSPIEKNSSTGI